ncbi:DOT1-domain-containing protein [Ramaria rubella]|nr:DOT1-domain-containing protein [Ramaria rubella]
MLASHTDFSWFPPSKPSKSIAPSSAIVAPRPFLKLTPTFCDPPLQHVSVIAPPVSPTPKKRKRAQERAAPRVVPLPMVHDDIKRVDPDPDDRDFPAKRVKNPTRASSSSSPAPAPRPTKPRRAVSAMPTRLVNGLTTPDRTRSPSARSRSTTEFGSLEGPIPRECWTSHDGAFAEDLISAETVVKKLMRSYKSYFRNPEDPNDMSFEPHPTDFPFVELEYPNTNAREIFPLLIPKDEDHYSPVKEVKKSLFTIIETYLTPSQASLFGTPPDQLRPSDFTPPKADPSRASSASPSSKAKSQSASRSVSPAPTSGDLLGTLTHANNRRDGPLFVATFKKISELLRAIKKGEYDEDGFRVDADEEDSEMVDASLPRPISDPNPMRKIAQAWNGVPPEIWKTIVDETYQRAVGPNIPLLRKYQAWSSEVYGELETDFVSDIVHHTGLTPSSRFFDMGSGVGTVVLQAALQAGCSASGMEKMHHPARIADDQLVQFAKRCRMWGVEPGATELLTGDFTNDKRVQKRIAEADVVLCNNWAFSEQLNQALLNHFLDMKEGAIVICLRSFIPPNFRLSEHTIGSPAAILRVEERPFRSGSVSWTCGGGVYFVNTIDRSMVAAFHERLQNGEVSRSRSTRSRR